jgi:hypothetical protein
LPDKLEKIVPSLRIYFIILKLMSTKVSILFNHKKPPSLKVVMVKLMGLTIKDKDELTEIFLT